ncbi:23S rRNA (adenine(2503)-C(2))-methyltransferase RlmN [Motilibacter aurantiacus]|uniref:23S rRNA (adenine(2503)-C(2))-methyltransferase RlmN n=1 Tax=Motilibacter aurantiacus TaxID=2714955 RepID=UPI001407B2D4|nr:23S rRNA (adenine(2503)-C(2))-methyltransferase RlmN [Motilibacter aurantiacus]NHC44614.1 23S rRNA (adenine(2503)-C(2))-methyltransferase RlmN [Motilibacter aurantiacus]
MSSSDNAAVPPAPTRPQPPGLVLAAPRRGKPPRHLSDLTAEERRAAVVELGEPAYRAKQLSTHWFGRLVDDVEQMPDLPRPVRAKLAEALLPRLLTPVREWETDGGATRKQLWRLHDGALVEAVLMRYGARVTGEVSGGLMTGLGDESDYDAGTGPGPDDAAGARRSRVTMCVSSQAGCGMACPFCATGQQGLTRNLSTAEIVEQVLAGARALERGQVAGGPGRVSNVVFMGMGEPLANYNAVLGAVRRLTDPAPDGLGMSRRGITVSTVGLAPAIRRLAGEGLPITLAVSLHAPDDELRDTLVPINTRYKVDEVLDAAWHYAETTSRRVSIEYALIRDVNDQAWRADLLGRKLKGHLVHVNLIPLNPTPGSKWTASRERDERAFVRALEHHGVAVTVRDTRGREIEGACGQLAAADTGTGEPEPAAAGAGV